MDKTLLKGLSVLEAIADMQGEARVIDDVAARVGLTRSNTHRTLQTLMHAGYVERDPVDGGYRGTMKMFALGVRQFGQLDGLEVIYIDKIDSVQPIRAYSMVGGRAPAYAVPRAQEGGFDLTVQAMSGIMSVTGEPGRPPVKCGVPLADFAAGLYGAFGIVSALRLAQATGQGKHIDMPMLGATLGIAALQTSEYFGSGRDPVRLGSAHPRNAPYRVFRSADGYFGMAAGNNALWRAVCATLGREDLLADERFQTPTTRAQHQDALLEILESEFAAADSATWLERFRAAGVPCAPINSYSEVLADPQVEHMEWVQPLELPNGVKTRTFASPLRMSGKGLPISRRPPALGEHNDEVLSAYRERATNAMKRSAS